MLAKSRPMDGSPIISYSKINVEKAAAYFAAEVSGIDFTQPIDADTFAEIEHALCEYEILIFRDAEMATEDQIRFGKMFGDLSVHPFSPNSDETPELIVFDNKEDNPPFGTDIWHSDETFRDCPPMATCLRALDVPKVGGDTMFSSMTAAYEGLSDRMKNFIDGLEAIHDFKPFKRLFGDDEDSRKNLQQYELMYPPVLHPVVRVHPVTGKKSLFVNPQFTIQVVGMGEFESRSLLTDLFDLAKVPEYQYRHNWYNNTMVIWDNRSLQHYAVHDYWPQRRAMERVTVAGDKPEGDGKADVKGLRSRKTPHPVEDQISHGGHAPKRQLHRELEKKKG